MKLHTKVANLEVVNVGGIPRFRAEGVDLMRTTIRVPASFEGAEGTAEFRATDMTFHREDGVSRVYPVEEVMDLF
jgi:hypothetical protein